MLLFLPIMLCCSALKIHLLCSILYAQEQGLLSDYMLFIYNFARTIHYMPQTIFIKTFLLECVNEWFQVYHYALSHDDCSIRVYRSFTTIFHKCLILLLTLYPIMLTLCLMLSVTHYAQNYGGIIGG